MKYKFDGKLFRRYTKNAQDWKLLECLFADDGALLASTREGAERATVEFQAVCQSFGLTVSIAKTSIFQLVEKLLTLIRPLYQSVVVQLTRLMSFLISDPQ